MSEDKRFVDYFDKEHNYIIQDLQNEDEYQVGYVNCDEDKFLELINELADENEELKNDYKTLQLQYDSLNDYRKELHDENEELKNDYKTLQLQYDNLNEYRKELKQNISTKARRKYEKLSR